MQRVVNMHYVGGKPGQYGPMGREERALVALLAHIGLWDCQQIADAFGTSRHAVYRAKRQWAVAA